MPSCMAGECLYSGRAVAEPAGVARTVTNESGDSFLFNDGHYIQLINWDCNRIGRRIFIYFPKVDVASSEIYEQLSPLMEDGLRSALHDFLASSNSSRYESSPNIPGYEYVNFLHIKDAYSEQVTILYYTTD